MTKKRVVAMLLAGGQGSRLKTLTKDIAKPAVPFGGKYRIIDFPLSNAANSGISDIAVLTQYKPALLNTHIGIGSIWDYDRNVGGLRMLQPFTSEDGGRWYTGTANAIYENLDFLEGLDPEYVLILSADHIYKMNYNDLLDEHIEKGADVTISVIEVPWDEASRFGIVNVDEDMKIVEFDEKPEEPKNNMASMGIYIFNWEKLRSYLKEDVKDPLSHHDFGKDILPKMLKDGNKLYAWNYKGYWKDVGTVRSYWQANMDLLDDEDYLDMYDKGWRIYTRSRNLPAQFISDQAIINNSLVNEGCKIKGEINSSIIFSEVMVEEGAEINNSVIMSGCVIGKNAKINNAVIVEGINVGEGEKVGENNDSIYLLSDEGILVE